MLRSRNPHDPPSIDPNYLADPRDIEDMVQGKQKFLITIYYTAHFSPKCQLRQCWANVNRQRN